jgi:transcriptional regulator with XRE-family HTH domain
VTLHLKAHREALGLTQQDVAFRCGLSVDGIQKLERQGSNPRLFTLMALSRGLALTIPELLAPPKKNGRKRKAS